jgi:hypothetical protein
VTKEAKSLTRKIGEVWKCIQCGKMAEDSKAKSRLRRHVETHLVDVSHSCSACGHTSTTSSALIKHIAKKHPELKGTIRRKPKVPKQASEEYDGPLVETTVEEADEKAEALIARIGEMLYCGECGKSMPKEKKWAMRRHVEIHLVGMTFPCELCGKHSKSTHGLYQHRAKAHPELKIIKHLTANYKCNICGKGSKTEKGLANHRWKYHREGTGRGGAGLGEMEIKMEENGEVKVKIEEEEPTSSTLNESISNLLETN